MNLTVYLLGMLAFTSGFYFIKKSETVWNGICGIFLSYMVWMLVQSMACELNVWLHIPVIAWQYGLLGIAVGGYWWFKIIKEKTRQDYRYDWLDAFVTAVLLIFAVGWGCYQFGNHLQYFNYHSVTDSARHLYFARALLNNQPSASMFFAAVNTAVWMSAWEGIVSDFNQYKIYIVFDLAVFFLNGMIFWMAIRRFLKDWYLKVVGVLFTVLFLFGHPLCSLVYGTAYLSTGIMLVLLLYYLSTLLIQEEISSEWGKGLLAFAMIALVYSYVLFLPAFIGGCLVYLYYHKKVRQNEITPKLIRRSCIFWGILFFLGVLYLYFFYVTGDAVLFSNLFPEGWMYGHPYADYLFLFPFLLLLLKEDVKNKRIGLEEFLFLLELGFVVVMFVGTFYGKISKYYLYKSYVPLWGAAFVAVMKYISGVAEKKRDLVTSVMITWLLMVALCVTDAENRLYQRSYKYGKLSAAAACFPMYAENLSTPRELEDKKELNDLLMKAAQEAYRQQIFIPYVSLCLWKEIEADSILAEDYQRRFYTLSGQNPEMQVEAKDWEHLEQELKSKYQYVLLVCDSGEENGYKKQLEQLEAAEIIMQNPYGCFVRMAE